MYFSINATSFAGLFQTTCVGEPSTLAKTTTPAKEADVTIVAATPPAKDKDTTSRTTPVILKSGQLPKPSETIFSSAKKTAEVTPEKTEAPKHLTETPKTSLFANFSFKTASETPKTGTIFGSTTTPSFSTPGTFFGTASGGIFGNKSQNDSSSSVFGSSVLKTPTLNFGAAPSGNDSTSASVFGGQAKKDDKTPVFGGSIFGGKKDDQAPVFGGNVFGNQSAPVFGSQTTAPGFGNSALMDSTKTVFNAEPGFSFATLAQGGMLFLFLTE